MNNKYSIYIYRCIYLYVKVIHMYILPAFDAQYDAFLMLTSQFLKDTLWVSCRTSGAYSVASSLSTFSLHLHQCTEKPKDMPQKFLEPSGGGHAGMRWCKSKLSVYSVSAVPPYKCISSRPIGSRVVRRSNYLEIFIDKGSNLRPIGQLRFLSMARR